MDVAASLLESFLGIDAVSGACMAALEVCEADVEAYSCLLMGHGAGEDGRLPRKISVDE